jgi:type III secretion system low calcium response chaperone LcrH/SycD
MEPEENVDVNQLIKTAVAETGKDLSPEDRKQCEEMMQEVIENGKTFAEVLGLTDEVLEGFYSVGTLLYNSGKYKKAENIFEVLCRLDVSQTKYWYGRAACAQKLKEYQKAIDYYMSWSFLEPENPIPYFHASDCYMSLDQKREAILFLYNVIRLCGDVVMYQKIKQKAIATQDMLKEQVGWEKEEE